MQKVQSVANRRMQAHRSSVLYIHPVLTGCRRDPCGTVNSRSPHLGAVCRVDGAVCGGECMVDAVRAWVGQVPEGHLSRTM